MCVVFKNTSIKHWTPNETALQAKTDECSNAITSLSFLHHHTFKDTFNQDRYLKAVVTPLLYSAQWTNSRNLFIRNTSQLQNSHWNFLSRHSTALQLVLMSGCPGFKESNRLPYSPSPMPLSEQQEKRWRRALHQLPPPHTAPPGIAGACGIKNGTRWQTKTVLSTSLLCCLLYCKSMKRLLWGIQ